ncbi:GntR family transcriptional regulator [Roseovarius albus]|nr:GntR family transcriptional regulator [Roseovarius albus]
MAGKRAVAKQSLPEIIANDLRERILSGEMAEGETIRQEALAEEYDVSRMPVREALKRLNAEGLVQWANNRGGSVTKHSLHEIGEIFDLRTLIEVDMFRRSIPNMTDTDFKQCRDILERMETSYDQDDVSEWGALNDDYHSALCAASGLKMTAEILNRLSVQSDRYVRMHLSVMQQRDQAKEEHGELLRLAMAGKVEEACSLLTRHVQRTKDELLELIAAKRAAEES